MPIFLISTNTFFARRERLKPIRLAYLMSDKYLGQTKRVIGVDPAEKISAKAIGEVGARIDNVQVAVLNEQYGEISKGDFITAYTALRAA